MLTQDPAPGPVPGNTVVKLTVSKGLPKVVIPNVANLTSVAAANQLGALGLVTTEQNEASDTIAAGTVIRTDPPAGAEVAKGATVVLVISTGATPVEVPNVVGMTESAATRRAAERQPQVQRGQRRRAVRVASGQRRDRPDAGRRRAGGTGVDRHHPHRQARPAADQPDHHAYHPAQQRAVEPGPAQRDRATPRKLASRSWPPVVRMDSGWNCTPSTGSSRWRKPMTVPSAVSAVTTRHSGRVSRSTTREW